MKILRQHMILFSLLLVANGCEKEYPWKLHSYELNKIVVEGILTSEYKPQHIFLSKPMDTLNGTAIRISGADIRVSDEDSEYVFTEHQIGEYVSLPFGAVTGRAYTLSISLKGENYSATAEMVPISPMPVINITLDSARGLYRYNYADDGTPSMMEVNYDWSSIPSYCDTIGSCSASEYFYSLPVIEVNKVFEPSKEIVWFPAGTVIIRRKYSLSEAHQEFLRSLLMETEWTGGIFDVQHGNVNSNISNGALGFFGVCMVLSDTTMVQ